MLPGTMNPGFYGAYRLPLGGAENQAWLLGGSYEEQTWQLWDFTGEPTVIREFPAVPNNYGPPSMDPTIFGSPSGGVFEGEPGDLRRLADGRLVLSTPRHVVVEQCTDPFTCEVVWLDRVSGKRDSAVVAPPIGNASFLWAMNASADGRLVFVPDWETGKGFIWDLYEGEVVTDLFQEGASFSPDSRYAVGSLRSGNLGVIDFDTGEIAEWDVPGGRYYGGGVFIPAG